MYSTQLFEWLYDSHHSRQYIFTGFLDIKLSYWIGTWGFSHIETWRSILTAPQLSIHKLQWNWEAWNQRMKPYERQSPKFHKFKDILRKHHLRFKYVGLNKGYFFWLVLFKRLSNKHPSLRTLRWKLEHVQIEKLLWKSPFFIIYPPSQTSP